MLGKRRVALCLVFYATVVLASAGPAQVRTDTWIVGNVELVQVPAIVFNNNGAVATDLSKDDFRIVDDGVEQKILHCDRDRVPVSFVVLADVSSSMTGKIPFVQEAALSLLEPPDERGQSLDEFSVLTIETRAKVLLPFSRDVKDMERRLPLLLEPTNGSTALFDGIYLGVNTAERQSANEHRAMIIISDGGDNHSRYNLYETKHMLEEADVPVFAVMAGPSFELPPFLVPHEKKRSRSPTGRVGPPSANLPFGSSPDDYIGPSERHGPHNLKTLTEATGGGVFTASQVEDLPRIVRTIGEAVRYRYVLSYKPLRKSEPENARGKAEHDPARHKIHLELYPKEKFRGYYLPYYKRGYNSLP